MKTGVKGLLGLIDGTLVQIKGVSGVDEPAYICPKNCPSLNVQLVGPDTEFCSLRANAMILSFSTILD